MKNTTQHLLFGLLITAFVAGCSRPVAYFQPSPRERVATAPAQASSVALAETPATPMGETTTGTTAATDQLVQAQVALTQLDAVVRNDHQLTRDKSVQKRLDRVQKLLVSASAKATPSTLAPSKRANLMERLVLKRMDKKINRQLAPKHPDKAMISTGTLALGAVLVIVGLLLLLLTTGTGATVGLIALLVGAVVLLIGLL